MSIKRYIANKDNTITNAFKENLTTRAVSSSLGASDILETFSIYGQASNSSLEKARILVQFPIDDISSDRTAGSIPTSGSVNFILKMSNAEHSSTTPEDFNLSVHVITSASWDEGFGIDMETYKESGASNWLSSSTGNSWTTPGGDFLTSAYRSDVSFASGNDDLEVDISAAVEAWLDSTNPNYGLLIKMSGSAEDGTLEKSFYTKRFFARSSSHFFKRPNIEARWDDSVQDDRGSVIKSSSLAPSADNLNSLYLYNRIRGNLRDIPNTGSDFVVQLVPSLGAAPVTVTKADGSSTTFITASRSSRGVYKATFAYSGTETTLSDIWQSSDSEANPIVVTELYTGSAFTVGVDSSDSCYSNSQYVVNITNLKPAYHKEELANFRIYTRSKDWQPNIYTVASSDAPVNNIREGFYKIVRSSDNHVVIPYSTSSSPSFSKLSYDVSGSYFDLDISILEPNYLYEISFLRKIDSEFIEQKERFKFRVDP
jgi:hypothetical protein